MPRKEPRLLQVNNAGTLYPLNEETVISLVDDNKKGLALARKRRLLAAVLKYNAF